MEIILQQIAEQGKVASEVEPQTALFQKGQAI
jgi:hypothetical protein